MVSSLKEAEPTASEEKGQTSYAQTSNPQQSLKDQAKTEEKKRKHESADEDATGQDSKRARNSVAGETAEEIQTQNCCPDKAP